MWLHVRIKTIIVASPRAIMRFGWPSARPRPLGEQEIKDRAGFPFSLRREAWRLRKAVGNAELPTSLRIRGMCQAKFDEVRAWFRGRAAILARRLAATDLSSWSRHFKPVIAKATHKHTVIKTEFIAQAGQLERERQEAQDGLDAFKTEQGIDRTPIEPSHRALPVAVIFALITTEAFFSAPLFGRVSDYGDIGGFFLGLGFGVLPPLLGVCGGFFGFRMIFRKQPRYRFFGGTIVLAVAGKMSGYALVIAHYRLALIEKPTATLADALSSIAGSWTAFAGSFEACGLLVISIGAFALGVYEGARRLADPIWGYSAVQRRLDEAEANNTAVDETYIEKIESTGREAAAEINEIETKGLKKHKQAASAAEGLVRDQDHANSVIRGTLWNCATVLGLCDGELRDLGWVAKSATPLALPVLRAAGAGVPDEIDALDCAENKPTQVLAGVLQDQRAFGVEAVNAREQVAAAVNAEVIGVPLLRRRIAEYVRKYLDTPPLLRGPFDPLVGVA